MVHLVTIFLVAALLSWAEPAGARQVGAIEHSGSVLTVDVLRDPDAISMPRLRAWVTDAARSVTSYYGRVPMKEIIVRITPVDGTGVGFSEASAENGRGLIELRVGQETSADEFKHDWTLTHEMLHMGFPLMDEDHRWLAEGIAVYVEPIARMQTGILTAKDVWRDLVKKLPHGLNGCPRGLNNATSIDGIYWGGALYSLLADVQIRELTHGKKGLQDALKAVLNHGGDIASKWEFDDAIKCGDKALGLSVLQQLYDDMAEKRPAVDLNKLFSQLGVRIDSGEIVFDDRAPLAWIRRSITPPPKI